MPFVGKRVTDAVWPEFLGVATYGGGMLAASAIDAAWKTREFPIAQTITTYGSLATSGLAIGYNKAPDFSKGMLFGSGVGIVLNLLRYLYEKASGAEAVTKVTDVAALVPRMVGKVKPKVEIEGKGVTFQIEKGKVVATGLPSEPEKKVAVTTKRILY